MEGDHFKDLCADGRTISECISKNSMGWDGMNWIYLAQDWYRCNTLFNTATNLQNP
jgi:hypothetical protein